MEQKKDQISAAVRGEAVAKSSIQHDSDCSLHNMPAYPAGPCDCTAKKVKPDFATDEEWSLMGRQVEGSQNGVDWFAGELVEIIDLFAPYRVNIDGEPLLFQQIRPVIKVSARAADAPSEPSEFTALDLAELEHVAKKADPIYTDLYGDRYSQGSWSRVDLDKEQDEFIAAFKPATVLALIAAVKSRAADAPSEPPTEILAKVMTRDDFNCSTELGYAQFLAWAIWLKSYRNVSTDFSIMDNLKGVLSQIDNMVCGLSRAADALDSQPTDGLDAAIEVIKRHISATDLTYKQGILIAVANEILSLKASSQPTDGGVRK